MHRTGAQWYRILLLALACLLPAQWLHAASLSGIVRDPSGAVVSGAVISLQGLPRGATVQTVTDAQGRFRFGEAVAGSYALHVTKDGFAPWERTVGVADKPIDLGVSLKLKTFTETVQVSGKRSPLANSDANYIALRGGKLTKVYRVNNLTLHRDVGVFTFRSGSFSFLPPVLGRTTTGVFVGDGNFQLKPAYDLAVKHLRRIAGTDSVDEDFTAMVVYFSDSTFDEIKQHAELADESPERHEDAFRRVKNILERRREPSLVRLPGRPPLTLLERLLNFEDAPNYDAEILAELYNPAQGGSFRAFLHGRKHGDLRFLVNPRGAMPMLAAPEETALLNFDPDSESDGIWYLSHLASELRSGSASSSEDKRLIAPEHYQIQVFVGKQNALGSEPDLLATCNLSFRALEDGVRMVKFDLMPDLQVSRVVWSGKDIPFIQESRRQDGSFYLQTPEPLIKGNTYRATFEYSGGEILQSRFGAVPPRRVWYPTPAGAASRATYDLTFHVPRDMTIVSVGKLIKQTREGAIDVSEWSSDVPITQAVFRYVGDYFGKTTTDEATNMQLAAYVSTGGRGISASANDVLIDTGNCVRIFTNWFGPPAYGGLSVVVGSATDSLPGLVYASPVVTAGWSSLVTLSLARSGGRFGGPPATMRTLLDEAFSRQVSGQWWGNTVSPVSFHDAWLSTGFANFSTSLYDLAAYLKPEEFRDHWVKAREAILVPSRFGVANDTGPVWMGLLNDTYKNPTASYVLNTSKGGYILHMLRSMMWDQQTGDADFRAMMQDYVKQFANRAASTDDFKGVVEKHMKPVMDLDGNHRMDWYFREWLLSTDVPSYRLEYSLGGGKGAKPFLSGKLTQSGVSQDFKMLVPIFAEFAGRKVRVGLMAMRGDSTGDFQVALAEAPKRVLLNVNHDVLTDKEEVKLVK